MNRIEFKEEMLAAINFESKSVYAAGILHSLATNQAEQSSKLTLNKSNRQLIEYSFDLFVTTAVAHHAIRVKQPLKN